MTSWIAIDESRKVTGPSRHEAVPQELPYGTTAHSFGLRAAALPVAYNMAAPSTFSLAEPATKLVALGSPEKTMFPRLSRADQAPSSQPSPLMPMPPPASLEKTGRRTPALVLLFVLALIVAALLWWLVL